MLEHYRAALAWRRAQGLRNDAMEAMQVAGDVVSFRRVSGDRTLFCAFNLGDGVAEVALPPGQFASVGQGIGAAAVTGASAALGPWQYCLAVAQER